MREYKVRYYHDKQCFHVIRIENGSETVLEHLEFRRRQDAEATAKHLNHAKRPAQDGSPKQAGNTVHRNVIKIERIIPQWPLPFKR